MHPPGRATAGAPQLTWMVRIR